MVPTLATPHFVLAQLLLGSGDKTAAAAEAAKGKSYYHTDLESAVRAVGYYESVLDLENAAFFLREILRIEPGNTKAQQDLDKVISYEQSKK